MKAYYVYYSFKINSIKTYKHIIVFSESYDQVLSNLKTNSFELDIEIVKCEILNKKNRKLVHVRVKPMSDD
mgnify:CR=1 FL=1